MQKSYSTYLSGSVLHEVNDYDCDIFKVHTCVGTHFGGVIAYHRVGAYFAFWSWVAGAVAGCRRRVPLQGASVRVLCGLWSWVALQLQGCRCRVPLQGAAECCLRFGAWLLVRCSRCLCCCSGKLRQVLSRVQSFFSFSLFVFRTRRALAGWYAFQPRWPRFGLVLAASFLAYATVAVVLRAA